MPSNEATTMKLILAFVTLLLGVILVGTVASEALNKTEKDTITDEIISLTNAYGNDGLINISDTNSNKTVVNIPTTWKSEDCPLTSVTITNASGTSLTASTDYNLYASSGLIQFLNTDETNITNFASSGENNNSLVDYTYCGDEYMNLSWGRTTVNLVPGFFAIALLLISVGLFFSVAKDYGIF